MQHVKTWSTWLGRVNNQVALNEKNFIFPLVKTMRQEFGEQSSDLALWQLSKRLQHLALTNVGLTRWGKWNCPTMARLLPVWTGHRVLPTKIWTALWPQVLDLIRDVFGRCTDTCGTHTVMQTLGTKETQYHLRKEMLQLDSSQQNKIKLLVQWFWNKRGYFSL